MSTRGCSNPILLDSLQHRLRRLGLSSLRGLHLAGRWIWTRAFPQYSPRNFFLPQLGSFPHVMCGTTSQSGSRRVTQRACEIETKGMPSQTITSETQRHLRQPPHTLSYTNVRCSSSSNSLASNLLLSLRLVAERLLGRLLLGTTGRSFCFDCFFASLLLLG